MRKIQKILFVIMFMSAFVQSSDAGLLDPVGHDVPRTAVDASFKSQGTVHTLAEYRGHKVMLWLFSTWCHSCIAGLKVMQDNQTLWKQNGLIILAVRNPDNGGYPGPKMSDLFNKVSPNLLQETNWVTGEASKEMAKLYNGRMYPDIYYLIDEQGQVKIVSTAPSATLHKIKQFAEGTVQ